MVPVGMTAGDRVGCHRHLVAACGSHAETIQSHGIAARNDRAIRQACFHRPVRCDEKYFGVTALMVRALVASTAVLNGLLRRVIR